MQHFNENIYSSPNENVNSLEISLAILSVVEFQSISDAILVLSPSNSSFGNSGKRPYGFHLSISFLTILKIGPLSPHSRLLYSIIFLYLSFLNSKSIIDGEHQISNILFQSLFRHIPSISSDSNNSSNVL